MNMTTPNSATTPGYACDTASGCVESLEIVPLRYCVMCSKDDSTLTWLTPTFPYQKTGKGKAGQRLHQVYTVKGEDARTIRYGARLLRNGYLYFFSKRLELSADKKSTQEMWGLDGGFSSNGRGDLGQADTPEAKGRGLVTTTYTEGTGAAHSVQGCKLKLHQPNDVIELRVLFTPTELTAQRIAQITDNGELAEKLAQLQEQDTTKARLEAEKVQQLIDQIPQLRERMQLFDIKTVLEHNKFDVDSLMPEDILTAEGMREVFADAIVATKMQTDERNGIEVKRVEEDDTTGGAFFRRVINLFQDQLYQGITHDSPTTISNRYVRMAWLNALLKQLHLDSKTAEQRQGIAIVLDDAIGITQELNNWRNDALETTFYQDFMNQEVDLQSGEAIVPPTGEEVAQAAVYESYQMMPFASERGSSTSASAAIVTNERLVNAVSAYELVEKRYELLRVCGAEPVKKAWKTYKEKQATGAKALQEKRGWEGQYDTMYWEFGVRTEDRVRQELGAALKQLQTAIDQELPNRDHYRHEYPEKHYDRYINDSLIETTKTGFDQAWADALTVAEKRAKPHLAWLKSDAVHTAFSFYTAGDVENGQAFSFQIGLCVMGMDGMAEDGYSKFFDDWLSPIEGKNFATDRNLLLRAICLNDQQAYLTALEMRQAIMALDEMLGDQQTDWDRLPLEEKEKHWQFADYVATSKKLVDAFKTLYDMKLPEGHVLAGRLAVVQQWQKRLLTYGANTALDYRAYAYFRNLLAAELADGALAHPNITKYHGSSSQRQPRRIVVQQVEDVLAHRYTDGKSYTNMRLASMAFIAEALTLVALLFSDDSHLSEKEKAARSRALLLGALSACGAMVSLYTTMLQGQLSPYTLQPKPVGAKGGTTAIREYVDRRMASRYANLKLIGACLSSAARIPLSIESAYKRTGQTLEALNKEDWLLTTGYGMLLLADVALFSALTTQLAVPILNSRIAAAGVKTFTSAVNNKVRQEIAKQTTKLLAAMGTRHMLTRAALSTATVVSRGLSTGKSLVNASRVSAVVRLAGSSNLVGLGISAAIAGIEWGMDYWEKNRSVDYDVWLGKSVLRKHSNTILYKNLELESEEFAVAIRTLGGGVPVDVLGLEYVVEQEKFIEMMMNHHQILMEEINA